MSSLKLHRVVSWSSITRDWMSFWRNLRHDDINFYIIEMIKRIHKLLKQAIASNTLVPKTSEKLIKIQKIKHIHSLVLSRVAVNVTARYIARNCPLVLNLLACLNLKLISCFCKLAKCLPCFAYSLPIWFCDVVRSFIAFKAG